MRFSLDGSDWLVNHFLDEEDFRDSNNPFAIDNMLLDAAPDAGFLSEDADLASAMKATVPGCDRSVLEENGEIRDLYVGRNVERTEWCEKKGWAFRKEFVLPKEMCKDEGFLLTFQSLGYRVRGFLNNYYLGTHRSMFIPWTIDVSEAIRKDGRKNVLVLIFSAAPKASPNHKHTCPAEFAYHHFCQMSFGWDWSRRLVPTGIFDHVELHSVRNARVADAHFTTSGKRVKVDVEIGCREEASKLPVEISLTPKNCAGKPIKKKMVLDATPGTFAKGHLEFEYPDAEFWYPNGYGKQPLYELKVSVPGDEKCWQVSFRDQKMLRNPGIAESSYPLMFEFNGKKIFARGANWVPADLVLSKPDAACYERLVRLAAAQGFNLFRAWGGGILEKEEFYDACDRYGIMVWQEFPHACSSYPCDNETISLRRQAAEAFIRRSRNHPSMSLYCGANEVLYYGEFADNPIYKAYGELVAELAPDKPYHISSPDLSRPGERNHGPWRFAEHSFWNDHFRNLASELGCEGFSEVDSIDRFIRKEDPLPSGQEWKYHFTFSHANRGRPFAPIQENFALDCKDRWEASQASMFTQGAQLAYVYAHYRALFPKNCGCFVWQFNDSWPTNAFSIVDYYSFPKMAHYMIGRANAPHIIAMQDESWRIRDGKADATLKLVCDTPLKNAVVRCSLQDIEGKELALVEKKGDFEAGVHDMGHLVCKMPKRLAGNIAIAYLSISTGAKTIWQDERIYGVPDFRLAFHLQEATVKVTKSALKGVLRVTIRNTGKTALLNLRVHAADVDFKEIFWKNNYITLMPGEERTLEADYTGKAPKQLELHAWNLKKTIL